MCYWIYVRFMSNEYAKWAQVHMDILFYIVVSIW